jgi:hypothetical protein
MPFFDRKTKNNRQQQNSSNSLRPTPGTGFFNRKQQPAMAFAIQAKKEDGEDVKPKATMRVHVLDEHGNELEVPPGTRFPYEDPKRFTNSETDVFRDKNEIVSGTYPEGSEDNEFARDIYYQFQRYTDKKEDQYYTVMTTGKRKAKVPIDIIPRNSRSGNVHYDASIENNIVDTRTDSSTGEQTITAGIHFVSGDHILETAADTNTLALIAEQNKPTSITDGNTSTITDSIITVDLQTVNEANWIVDIAQTTTAQLIANRFGMIAGTLAAAGIPRENIQMGNVTYGQNKNIMGEKLNYVIFHITKKDRTQTIVPGSRR